MTKIEWTQATWNPIVGCSIVSPGCTNCYAMKMAARLEAMQDSAFKAGRTIPAAHYSGTTKWVNGTPVWTGKVALAPERILAEPLRRKKPTTYFVNSMGDLFHEDVPDQWIDRVFAVMAMAPQHTFQCLTKRSVRMRAYCDGMWARREELGNLMGLIGGEDRAGWYAPESDGKRGWSGMCVPLPNVWFGVSAERQQEADARIPDLLATPAAIRFVSAEPLLGPIDFTRVQSGTMTINVVRPLMKMQSDSGMMVGDFGRHPNTCVDWIIVGGESGPGARPMHPDWARSIRDQCAVAGVSYFFKQWGSWRPLVDRDRHDPDWRLDYFYDYADTGKFTWLNVDGCRGFHGKRFHVMQNVGKKSSGRLLDGREHNDMPNITVRASEAA